LICSHRAAVAETTQADWLSLKAWPIEKNGIQRRVIHSDLMFTNGRYHGVHIQTANDQTYADPSLDGKHSDGQAIVEITAIQLAPKVLNFEPR
jgi:hypothetical protein